MYPHQNNVAHNSICYPVTKERVTHIDAKGNWKLSLLFMLFVSTLHISHKNVTIPQISLSDTNSSIVRGATQEFALVHGILIALARISSWIHRNSLCCYVLCENMLGFCYQTGGLFTFAIYKLLRVVKKCVCYQSCGCNDGVFGELYLICWKLCTVCRKF